MIAFTVPGQSFSVNTAVEAEARAEGDSWQVFGRLPENLHAAFADMTAMHAGKTMALSVCGKQLNRPTLRTRIENGVFAITGLSEADAERVAAQLNRGRCD
ncbi:MAG: hypothetical protein KDJ73_02510 [Notoacmeibacter sp.]|nr:hypothetical protein [Notoacmeibacter sp.]MCC0031879.1 hypothetical protein [Brucellaceae bacterium]